MSLSIKLSRLHSLYNVYSSGAFHSKSGNILYELCKHEDFDYLNNFYKQYINSYDDTLTSVIEAGHSKFFFVFEGSLSQTEKLSITVLSHLWLTKKEELINKFCGKDKWWTFSNYHNIHEKLNITKDFANHSYVTDALRVGSNNETNKKKKLYELNQELIYKEIVLLKPKLVICVGKTAEEIVGMKYLNQDTKFHSVMFPKYHNEVDGYNELHAIMESI
jgi:hypothetical protein